MKNVSGLLLVAFVVLKLCGVINWSWLWVLSPLWIVFSIVVILAVVATILEEKQKREMHR